MQWKFALLTSALCGLGCPVEHVGPTPGDDSGLHADGGDADAAAVDHLGLDLAQRDAAGHDAAGSDAAGHDAGGHDAARPDAAPLDAAPACANDDSFEPNNSAVAAAAITAPGTVRGLMSCDDDWFAFTAPAGNGVRVVIDFNTSAIDLDLYLFRAADPTRSIDTSMSTHDIESVRAAPFASATPLLIRVKKFTSGAVSAPYTLSIELAPAPANDTCPNAAALEVTQDGQPHSVEGNTLAAGNDYVSAIADCYYLDGDGSADVYYRFTTTAAMSGYVFFDLRPAGWSGVVIVASGACGALTERVCSTGVTYVAVQPSTTYTVVVDAYDGAAGPFTLEAQFVPAGNNTTCENAAPLDLPLNGGVVKVYSVTEGDTDTRDATDTSTACQSATRHAPERFYRVDVPAADAPAAIELFLETSGWDAALYTFDRACSATGSDLQCRGEYGYDFGTLWYQLPVSPGTSYTIVVDGYGDVADTHAKHAGPFKLQARYYVPQPTLAGGETCGDAVALDGARGSGHGSTASGTNDISDVDGLGCSGSAFQNVGGYDKFYRLTLQPGQTAMIQAQHASPWSNLVLYALQDHCAGGWRVFSCVAAAAADYQSAVRIEFSNTTAAAAVYYAVVDARYYYEGEEYDLFWDVTGP